MKNVYIVQKEVGETPLECLEKVRVVNGIAASIPMTYAGRLDPMAEGVLIILVDEECKNKEKYLGLDKEYEVEVLLGIETDTFDLLGKITSVKTDTIVNFDEKFVTFNSYVKKFTQVYPAYSSKIIAMKEVPEEMPTKEVEIYSIDRINEHELVGSEIVQNALEKIEKVKGDFRQKEIVEGWKKFGEEYGGITFRLLCLRVRCSSGTYMRTLAHTLGKDAGTGAIAYSIKRTNIFL